MDNFKLKRLLKTIESETGFSVKRIKKVLFVYPYDLDIPIRGKIYINCRVSVDMDKKHIHILDLDKGGMSVTNGIDRIQDPILYAFDLDRDVHKWIWFLYGTDGVVSIYDSGTFTFVPEDNQYIHAPFLTLVSN